MGRATARVRQAGKGTTRKKPIPVIATKLDLAPFDAEAMKDLLKTTDNAQVDYIDGEAVPYEIANVPIALLDLWEDNPRTACVCEDEDEDKETIKQRHIETLLHNCKTDELALDIAINGGAPDAIVGTAKPDGRIQVIEGNRRGIVYFLLKGIIEFPEGSKVWGKKLQARLQDIMAEKPLPDTVSVKLYKDISRAQQLKLLAMNNVSGKQSLGSFGKGYQAFSLLSELSSMNLDCESVADLRRVWKELTDKDQATLKEVAAVCGLAKQVRRLRVYVMAYIANALYCGLYDVAGQSDRFTYFAKFYSKGYFREMSEGRQPKILDTETKNRIEILWPDEEIEEKFMAWLAEGRIVDCVNVDNLHLVLSDSEIFKFFSTGSVKDHNSESALKMWDQVNDPLDGASFAATALSRVDPQILKKEKGDGQLRTVIRELKTVITTLEKDMGEKL
jgi:hypothetical protein